MKITDVRTAEIKGHGYSTYVRIYTDEGVIGNGECIHGGEGCPEMVHALKQHIIGESPLNVDMLFLGVHGMSTHAGFTTPNLMEAETNRALVAAARRLAVVADHTKWELVGISTIAQLHDAQMLITDAGLSPAARDQLSAEVGELVVADYRT